MTMRFSVEAWAAEYGAPMGGDGDLSPAEAAVVLDVEVPVEQWAPVTPRAGVAGPDTVLFTDGVRRVDARVWLHADAGRVREGVCASYAAGAVRCNGKAAVVEVDVARGLFCRGQAEPILTRHGRWDVKAVAGDGAEQLALGVQQRMGELEVAVADRVATGTELVVVDGPLTGRQGIPGAVGYVKTHRVAYLPAEVEPVVRALAPGQRTPLFLTTGSWSRWSWYLRLAPPDGHPWSAVVRCELSADEPLARARDVADVTATRLPPFASQPHKDPRAPQNLTPIAGLERELRRRLGDAALLYRALRAAARA